MEDLPLAIRRQLRLLTGDIYQAGDAHATGQLGLDTGEKLEYMGLCNGLSVIQIVKSQKQVTNARESMVLDQLCILFIDIGGIEVGEDLELLRGSRNIVEFPPKR